MALRKEIKYFLIRRLLTSPAYYFLNVYAKTIRVTFEGDAAVLDHIKRGGRVLFASWHQRFFGGFYIPHIYSLEPCIMISRSRDGDFIAEVVQKIGWRPVRGSSTRGGREALQVMIRALKEQNVGGHIVDGPTGPPRVIKPGLITIAHRARAVICPAYVLYEKPWIINSWDRFMIPKPFSRVQLRFGRLIEVPEGLGEEAFEALRSRIEREMIDEYDKAERDGWKRDH